MRRPYIAHYKRGRKIRCREVYAASWNDAAKKCPDHIMLNGRPWRLYGGPLECVGLEGLGAPSI